MNVAVFVYGTLMDEATVRSLTGRSFARKVAVLRDFERSQRAGDYAYIRPRAGKHVEGLLLTNVDPISLARFDEYEDEGRLYRRIEVVVDCGGRTQRCFTYGALDSPRHPA